MAKKKIDEKIIYKQIIHDYTTDRKYIDDRGIPKMWSDGEKMYNNEYWEGSDRPDHLTKATHNAGFEAVETMLPVVTSRPPSPDVKAQPSSEALDKHLQMLQDDPESAEESWKQLKDAIFRYGNGLTRELKNVWKHTKMNEKIKQEFREYEIKGTDVVKSYWNSKTKRIEVEICDVRTIVPYRFAESIDSCEDTHFCHAFYKPISWVSQKYNIPLEDIKAEGELDADGNFQLYDSEKQPAGAISGAISAIKSVLSPNQGQRTGDGMTLVIEYYCPGKVHIDEETSEDYKVNVYNKNGEKTYDKNNNEIVETKQRAKWKNGRVITICRGCLDKVLADKQRGYKKLPFFKSANYSRAGDFWGTSEFRNIEKQIGIINMIISNITDNARLTGNPQKERVIGSEVKEVTNEPGAVYDTAIPGGIRNLNPGTMPAYIQHFLNWVQNNSIDRITGITDAFRGIAAAGDSGIKVQHLIDQGTGRLQPKTMSFTTLSRDLFAHWADIIQNFYPEKIIQKMEDKSGEAKYDVFRPRQVPDAIFEIDVNMTALLPTDKSGQFEEAMAMAEMGMRVFGIPLISPEMIIEMAPSLEEKQRAKEWLALMQKKMAENQQEKPQMNQDPINASDTQLRELGMSDEEIGVLSAAKEAGDEEGVRAILGKYIPEEPQQ